MYEREQSDGYQVAAYLQINEVTAYNWAQKGKIPGKVGRIWRFRRNDIEAWLDQNMRGPEPEVVSHAS